MPHRIVEISDVLGDGDSILLGARPAGAGELTAILFVDHNLGTVVKDAFVIEEPLDETVRQMSMVAEESADLTIRYLEPAAARARIGGSGKFRPLIDAFYDRVERDDLLSPFFPGGVHEEHRAHVTAWWIEVFGGPADYTETLGGYPAMLRHHLDLGITAEQRFRFAALMSRAADDAGLPDDPEFRAAFVGYVEWGTRLALGNSEPGADVVTEAPVPHWGWGVAPPYQP
jgi:hemoglobin